ncbi:MAG: nucleotide disphospho-sugar-binding domain-containing protein [Actinomycetota bacterium]
MATIVIATNGRTSLLNSYRELASRLRAAGHRVVIVTGASTAERLRDEEPATAHEVVGLDHDRRFGAEAEADPPPGPTDPVAVARWVRRRRRLRDRSIDGDEVATTIESLDPDLLILDTEFQVGILATAGLDVPRVLAMTFFSIFAGPDLPPVNTSLPAPVTALDRLRVRLAWRWVRLGGVYARLSRRLSRAGVVALLRPMPLDSNDLADLRPLARRCGVDLRAVTDRSQWLRPYLIRDLPVLCLNAAELDLPHHPSPRIEYLGPLLRTDRAEPELDDEDRARLEALVAARAEAAEPRPLIYATLGTFAFDDRSLLDRIVAVAATEQGWDLVIGLGGAVDPDELAPLPPNVLALRWAPQLRILAEADVVITHGGTGTLREAVHHGVPSVVFPTGHGANDQAGAARRIAHHRLGVVGDPSAATADDIAAAITEALTDPEIRAGVAELQQASRAYTDEGRAVASVERHLRPTSTARPSDSVRF